ncbi:MAG: alpha/beta fold hydrolase [Actinomycetota bacterium]
MSEGWLEVDDGRLWYERRGEGFPVVLAHPRFWDSRIWDEQFEEFARHHDVIRYDQRGHGRSDPPRDAFSEVRDLLSVLEAMKVERCAIVGCGSGGRLAIDFALALPEVAEAIVAVAPGLSGYRWRDPGLGLLLEEVDLAVRAGDLRRAMDLELAVWAPVAAGDPATNVQVRAIAMDNAGALRVEPLLVEEPPSALPRLGDVQAATLVVVGDKDLEEVHEIAELLARSIPGARKLVIADADLLVNMLRPERFNRLVLDFLTFRA